MNSQGTDLDDLLGSVVEFEIYYPNDQEAEVELRSISPNAEEVFGYGYTEWERPEDQWLQMLYPGDYARAVSASWATSRHGTPLAIECRMVRADGRIVWVRDEETMERQDAGELWHARLTVIHPPDDPGWTPVSLGPRIIEALGDTDSRTLLSVLERSDADRKGVIGGFSKREDLVWLAELLSNLEMDEAARLRVAAGLRLALGPN